MSRFYVQKEKVGKEEIIIDGNEAHHILDVMRLSEDEKVVVFDGTGNEYSGFIKSSDKKRKKLVVGIISIRTPLPGAGLDITLAQAIPKMNKMDHIIEKTTELGIRTISPVITERTIVRPDQDSCIKKVDKWGKIAIEAAKQCGRTDVPEVTRIRDYKDLIEDTDNYDLILLACLSDRTGSLRDALSGFKSGKILVLIGPEGDFSPNEIRLAERDNCRFVSLGERVLKSDTAGLFVLSVLNYEFSI